MVLLEDWLREVEKNKRKKKLKKWCIVLSIYISIILNSIYLKIIENISEEEILEDSAIMSWLFLFTFVLLIFLLVYKSSINRFFKNKDKSLKKDFNDLLEPAISEGIIDQEMNLKELIMSIIIQTSLKGNINIINDNEIELVHKENLNKYELELINFLFENKTNISFKEINKIITGNLTSFITTLSDIKVDIINRLKKMKLFNKEATKEDINIKCISYMLLVDLPIFTMINVLFLAMTEFSGDLFIALIVLIFGSNLYMYLYFYKTKISQLNLKESYMVNKLDSSSEFFGKSIIVMNIVFLGIMLVLNIQIGILYLIDFILCFIIFQSKDKIILNEKGYEEKSKLMELKRYLKEYSLMKDRDLKEIVIWDEYMAYAVAFGIPTKIIKKIYEEWYDLNLTIQFWR